MRKFDLFVNKFEALPTEVQINVYNKYCKFELNGGTIYRMDELDEMFTGVAPTKLFAMTSEGFSINDRYFIITSFGLESFNEVDVKELIEDFEYEIYKCHQAWKNTLSEQGIWPR